MIQRKNRKKDDAAEHRRKIWSGCFEFCWSCGAKQKLFPLETHEIVRRSETSYWCDERNFTKLCRACHEEAHGGWLTKDVLLTLKLIFDPVSYDPDWVRTYAIRQDWEAGVLPEQCRWFIHA